MSAARDSLGVQSALRLYRDRTTSVRGGQGQGASTVMKERGFASAFHVSLKLSMGLPDRHYFHFDMHAGSGWNDRSNEPGSPIVFIRSVANLGRRNVVAHFVDHHAGRYAELADRVSDTLATWSERSHLPAPRCRVTHSDNRIALPAFAASIRALDRPSYAMGTVLVDPNGYFDDIPFEELTAFCREFPRMDLIINLNMRYMRLARSHKQAGTSSKWSGKLLPCPSTLPDTFSRKHVLVQQRVARGDYWLLFIMRNRPTNGHASAGIYPLESREGRRIIDEYSETRSATEPRPFETETQASLF